jgi:hypothetical protein
MSYGGKSTTAVNTTTELQDKNHPINTEGKHHGQQTFNVITNKTVFASGASDVDPWRDSLGRTVGQYVPV